MQPAGKPASPVSATRPENQQITSASQPASPASQQLSSWLANYWLAGLLPDYLADWLAVCLPCQPARINSWQMGACLAGWLAGCLSPNQPASQTASWLAGWLAGLASCR